MDFKTPVKLMYDSKDRGTIFVHWKTYMIIDDSGISRLRPEILQILDIPITNFKIKIKIREHKYKDEIAFYLRSPAYFNSRTQELKLIFDTIPA